MANFVVKKWDFLRFPLFLHGKAAIFFPKLPRVDHNYAKIGHKNSVFDKIRLKIFRALRVRRKNAHNFTKICVPPPVWAVPSRRGGDNF